MRILFVLKGPLYARNLEYTLRHLVERGHRVHAAFEVESNKQPHQWELIERLEAELPGLTSGWAARRADDRWRALAGQLRLGLDYMRFYHPRYRTSPSLWVRAGTLAPATVRRTMALRPFATAPGVRLVRGVLAWMERAVPPSPEIEAFLTEQAPDVMVVSPLVRFGTPQADHLRAAKRLGIPNLYSAYSWDHLTTKGLIRGEPDNVTVWNEIQRREAVDLHGVPEDRVVAVGAAAFDHWFDWRPSSTREEFCARVGLRPDRPYLLYLGSALISGDEVPFVERWVRELRRHGDAAVREAGVLIRPHPKRPVRRGDFDLPDQEEVAIWPEPGTSPVGVDWRSTLFDSVWHSAAVVGLNTSAFIDAGVIGRPSYSLLPPEFSDSQNETVHFHYLTEVSGGLLQVAETLEQHVGQLSVLLRGEQDPEPGRRFIEDFVRPGGIEVSAALRLADAVEAVAADPRLRPPRRAGAEPLARLVLRPLAELAYWREEDAKRWRIRRKRARARRTAWRRSGARLAGMVARRRWAELGSLLGERGARKAPGAGEGGAAERALAQGHRTAPADDGAAPNGAAPDGPASAPVEAPDRLPGAA